MKLYNTIFISVISLALLILSAWDFIKNEASVFSTENRQATTLGDIKVLSDIEAFLIDQFPKRKEIMAFSESKIDGIENQILNILNIDIKDAGARYFITDANFYTLKPTVYDRENEFYKPMLKFVEYLKESTDKDIYVLNDGAKNKHTNFYNSYGLVSNYEEIEAIFQERLPSGVKFIDIVWDKNEVFKNLYKTDHHTALEGTIDIYKRIMEAIGKTDYTSEFPIKYYEGATFFGSDAKAVNSYEVYDKFYCLDFDKVNFKYKAQDIEYKFNNIDTDKIAEYNENKENYYSLGFGPDFAKLEIFNEAKWGGKRLLIIGDSFSNSLNHFLAYEYEYILDIDTRYYESYYGEKADIIKLVEENNINEILVYTDISYTNTIDVKK